MESLFIEPEQTFEKSAAEVSLSEDANAWPNEILQELFRQVPFISDFDPHIVMDRVDAEKGFGFGHVEVTNKTEAANTPEMMATAGVKRIRIPVIIRDRKLQPFDTLVTTDSKMLPLTEARLRQAIFRPQSFDVTSKTPGDMSMISQLYPPNRQTHGFGGMGGMIMGAGDIGKQASVLETILPTINENDYLKVASQLSDERLQAAYHQNLSTKDSISKLASYEPSSTKTASILPDLIKPSVLQLSKDVEGYTLKTASHAFWAPLAQRIDRGEAVRRCGEKIVLAADLEGAATVAEGQMVQEGPEADRPESIKDYGLYKVQTEDGQELVGYVFPNLLDVTGKALPIALFTNGSQAAVQPDIVGVRAGEGQSLPSGRPRGHGCFYRVLPNGKAEATIPFDIQASFDQTGDVGMMATSFDGQPVQIMGFQPHIQNITMEGDHVLIPQDFQWLPLDRAADVSLVSTSDGVDKQASAVHSLLSVTVRSGGPDCFSFDGLPIEKIADGEKQFLSLNDSLFLLAGLGVDHAYGQKKLAEAMYWSEPTQIRVGRFLKTAETVHQETRKLAAKSLSMLPSLKVDLVKEAAVIPDPVAVDTVLSLGFINPENITTFISAIPVIDQAQMKMCELLIASRLGLREVPTTSLERAIKSTEQVLEGLKTMAFEQN